MLNLYKSKLDQYKGQRTQVQKDLTAKKLKLRQVKRELRISKTAREIIKQVAQDTQIKLEEKLSVLVSRTLASIFSDPYEFKIEFVTRRERTEADLLFTKNGYVFNPLSESGGGTVDISSFALRLSTWAIQAQRTRSIFFFDEPFKNINDDTRLLHQKTALMLKNISERLGLQFIIVTQIPEIIDLD